MTTKRPPIIKNHPFIQKSDLSGRWYFVESYRQINEKLREAHVKHDVTDAIKQIITEHGGNL